MPVSMGSPNYKYTPWTPERRKAASEAGKARWKAKREAERLERERQAGGVVGRLNLKLSGLRLEMECARHKFFATKAAIEELEKAKEWLEAARPILRKHGVTGSQID